MSATDLTYAVPTREQAVAYLHIDALAFGGDGQSDIDRLDDMGWSNMRVALLGDEVVGGLVIFDDAQRFGGRNVRSWAIGGVAVAPQHRRRRVGRTLMLHMLAEARQADVPLSSLYASTPAFYRGFGYEPAGWTCNWTIDPQEFPLDGRDAEVRPMTEADRNAAADIHARSIAHDNGPLARSCDAFWQRVYDEHGGERRPAYLFTFDGRPEAFVVTAKHRPGQTMWIAAASATPRGTRAVGAFLHRFGPVVGKVQWLGGPADPLRLLVADDDARMTAGPEPWLLRLADVPAALQARGYPPIHAELHLDVGDAAMSANAGRCVLSLRGGAPTVQPGGSGRIRLDVRALAAIYTGYASPRQMQAADLLNAPADADDLPMLTAAFAGPTPYMVDKF